MIAKSPILITEIPDAHEFCLMMTGQTAEQLAANRKAWDEIHRMACRMIREKEAEGRR